MKEIKFRYLDTNTKKVFSTLEDVYDDNEWTEYQDFQWFGCQMLINGFSNIEKLLYTGLKDKNGKEIYEGDIVHNLPSKEAVLAPNGWTGTVVYQSKKRNDGFFDAYFCLKCGKEIYLNIAKNSEVIGNVFSNPELLTKE